MRVYILLILVLPVAALRGSAQCPGNDSIWKQMQELEHTPSLPVKQQLNRLLGYEKNFIHCPVAGDSVYAWLMMRIGIMYYTLSEFERAIQYTKKSLQVIQQNGRDAPDKKKYIVRIFYNLSVYYDSLKMAPQKEDAMDSCIAYEIKGGSAYTYSFFLLITNVKSLYYKGDYALCIDHASLGESIMHKYYRYPDSMSYIIFFISYKVMALYSMKKFLEAEQFLQDKKEECKKIRNPAYTAVLYSLSGYLNKSKANYAAAVHYFLKAYATDIRTPAKYISAEVLDETGTIYMDHFNKPDSALLYFRKALTCGEGDEKVAVYAHVADAFAHKGKFDSAFYFFRQAFNRIQPGIDERNLLLHTDEYISNNTTEHLLNLVLDKADTYLKQYHAQKNVNTLYEAFRIYKTADLLLNKMKAGQAKPDSKLFWRTYSRRLYEHAIEACVLAGNTTDALYFFEKSKAVLLNDQLSEQRHLSEKDMLQLGQVSTRIGQLEKACGQAGSSVKAGNDQQKELFLARQELNKLEQSIRNYNPFYYQVYLDTSAVNLQDIRGKLLKDGQALIELFNGDSAVYTLLITAGRNALYRIPKGDFDSTVRRYNYYLANPEAANTQFPEFTQAARHLYKLIFKDGLPEGRIIISPDGQYFPFESLVTSGTGKPVSYFLQDHAVSYTYSARFLLNNFAADSATAPGNFLGMAPVSYPPSFSLSTLSESDQSLDKVSGHFDHAVSLVSSNASRSYFMRHFHQYKIIQLYTHASDSSKNNEPVIYFSDSALYLSDLVQENRTMTKLIVLSACETGLGKDYKGEGVYSFNRGFAALGIPSSITNLWAVDNKSTYKLTEFFYNYLSKGLPLDIALQKAKLEFIRTSGKEDQLSYYWAAPILVGKTDPIAFNSSFGWKYVFAGMGLAILFFLGWKRWQRNKQIIQVPGIAQTVP